MKDVLRRWLWPGSAWQKLTQAKFEALIVDDVLTLPAGNYAFKDTVVVPDGVTLKMHGTYNFKRLRGGKGDYCISVPGGGIWSGA